MKKTREKLWVRDLCVLGAFALILCLYAYKLPLGMPSGDEAFYLTIPKRLLQGDGLVVDEWHGSQLSAFLTMPLMALRNALFPGSEGIVLQWRWLYVAVHGLFSLGVYLRLRRRGWRAVGVACLLFFFTPFDIPAYGYTALALDTVCLSSVVLYTAKNRRDWFLSGLLFAAGVLCTPYLVLIFALYALAVRLYCLGKREEGLYTRSAYFCEGCLVLAVALFAFIFSRGELLDFLSALPYILSDPAHPLPALSQRLVSYGTTLWETFGLPLGLLLGLLALALLDRGRHRRSLLYFPAAAILGAVMMAGTAENLLIDSYHFPLVPLALVGLMAYLLTQKRDRRLMLTVYLMGLGESLAIHLASNQSIHIFTAMYLIPDLASLCFIADLLGELQGENWMIRARRGAVGLMAACLLVMQAGMMLYVKINHKYWSSLPNSALTVTLAEGPFAGCRVGEEAAGHYESQLAAILASFAGREEAVAAFAAGDIWPNLIFPELRNGAFSAWLEDGRNATVDRWVEYYEMRPERLPQYILFYRDGKWNMDYVTEHLLKPYGFDRVERRGMVELYIRTLPPEETEGETKP